VVVYNLLLQQKKGKLKHQEIDKQNLVPEQKEEPKKVEVETPEKPTKNSHPILSLSVGNSPLPKKQKGKKPIMITARGEATPEKPQKKKEYLSSFQKIAPIPYGKSCGNNASKS